MLKEGGRTFLGLDGSQIRKASICLSPLVGGVFLWIFTLRRKVAGQTEALTAQLDRSERAEREVIRLNSELRRTQREIAFTLGEVIENRSKETANHVRRVAAMAESLALMRGLTVEESRRIALASSMHDIGKIGIPDRILSKPGPLSEEEFELMKGHTVLGYEILSRTGGPLFGIAARIAHEHHERWDGKGYPKGISGEDISMEARIVAIVDVFDALSHKRVYKEAWPIQRILDLISEERGSHFDPSLTDLFLSNFSVFSEICDSMPDRT
ncbi:HD domain-containing protein [Dethiosulfovibrio sp. F2B]|uniref:HD-GYP domain-containing protein n=1 Tax=Dethiosulfovibrio faecalis TaxID=2720018 RepID=UPI001F378063|nr:HD domain-containing phosphohydrolase [Dethiosulfovibrio faecalis]MCF4152009.1 HD domain-containing protein [Dethiosulfovibrio faecalis]